MRVAASIKKRADGRIVPASVSLAARETSASRTFSRGAPSPVSRFPVLSPVSCHPSSVSCPLSTSPVPCRLCLSLARSGKQQRRQRVIVERWTIEKSCADRELRGLIVRKSKPDNVPLVGRPLPAVQLLERHICHDLRFHCGRE